MLTASEIADILQIDRDVARGLIRFLREMRFLTDRGRRKPTRGGPGRGEDIYDFPDDLPTRVAEILKRLVEK